MGLNRFNFRMTTERLMFDNLRLFNPKSLAGLSNTLPMGRKRRLDSTVSALFIAGLFCLGLLAEPDNMFAQSTHGTFLGTIRDSSSSMVPGAQIKITSLGEGTSVVVTSDAEGNYRAPDFKPGHYRLEV